MKCSNCGAEIKEEAIFCPQCGVRQNEQTGQGMQSQQPQDTGADKSASADKPVKKGLPTGAIIGIGAAALAVVAAIVAAVIFLPGGSGDLGEGETVLVDSGTDGTLPEGELALGQQPEEAVPEETMPEVPLYSIPDVAWVDITAQNYTAGAKQPGMTWDSSFFYWLEDVNTNSPDDGYIAYCKVTKTLLRDAQSQKLRQYEVYSDPASGAIYKIVSIEEVEGGLSLVDYYYQNGQPNFIFSRGDTVYTPTYATIEKVGERYYFNSEVMVRWRMIREPGVIGEYVLTPGDVWYSQGDYYAENDELRSIYDDVELRMLNAAHNTYDAIAAGGNIGMVQGYLQDTVGNGIAGRTIKVYRLSDNALLYETVTDDSGRYAFFVYLDDSECYIKVEADDLYKETTVQGVRLASSAVTHTYGLTLHKNNGDEYPVTFHLYSCMDVVSDENGSTTGGALQAATAVVREGAGNYNGKPVCTAETQNGELAANLPSGVYTVQFHTEGYLDGYMEVEVMEEATVRDVYVMPGLAETQTGVILTWDSDEVDLDLTLFTPYQAENGDMAHIGGSVDWDGHGNILVSDNKSRCEIMFINSGEPGSYKLYVNDYTNSVAGNYVSDALYRLNVHVYIYNSNGLVADYTLPLGQTGVVWEVAEINGQTVTPAQRVYSEIGGKSWWTENKEVWSAEEDAALLETLEAESSRLRHLMAVLIHYVPHIDALLQGEKEGIEEFFGLNGRECPAAQCFDYVWENRPENFGELYSQVYAESFLTEQQAEYLIYSVCGRQIDFDFSVYSTWIAPYIGFGGAAGDITWDELDRFSVERVDANTWKVRANDVYFCEWEPSRIVSRVCFTVVKNPDSYFDGYSLTGFEVEEEANVSGWAKVYYDYLITGEVTEFYDGADIHDYNLIYVDDDLIPEIYVAEGDLLLFLSNGKGAQKYFYWYGGEYIPYTGLLKDHGAYGGVAGMSWTTNYKLVNGELVEIGEETYHWEDEETEVGQYRLGENEVTKEQYEETINSYFGDAELQPCILYDTYHDISLQEFLYWSSRQD